MKYPFVTLDVFTAQRFAGNPLAVVFDADGIEEAAMQKVAREFSHPETVFVLNPKAGGTAHARIFTPVLEMPFAGHPTVGTALALALRRNGGNTIALEEKIGTLKCAVKVESKDRGHAIFELPSLPVAAGMPADNAAIAAALGISEGDIGFDGHAPSEWSLGNAVNFVPLKNLDAVKRAHVVETAWDAAFDGPHRGLTFLFCGETVNKANHFHARMFAPRFGVREDPATGSAVAAFAGFCATSLALKDGEHRFVVEQGFEMGRPSLIELTLTLRDGALTTASIGGPAVIVTEGMIEV
ncbi:MAG: PhzF family phenazine biosynthesis protein [Xanthobacteraceae bacterium]